MKSYAPMTIIVVGLVLIATGILVDQVMPALGRAAYQAAAAGSYDASSYDLNLTWYYAVSGLIIAIGIATLLIETKAKPS